MKIIAAIFLGLTLLVQTGCSHQPAAGEVAATTDSATSKAAPAGPEAVASSSAAPLPPPALVAAATSRLLIYQADVRLKTAAMPRATASLDSLVRRSGGYLSAANETHIDGEWREESTIRVPPGQFQALLSGLADLGTVEEKKLTTTDVTAEHADVAARLQAKRAVERQYTALLTRAQKIKDILAIEEKLGEVREEIEATESRFNILNDEVAYSTITLTLYQPVPQTVPDAPIISLGSRTVEAFYGGWQLFISLLLGTLTLWPLVLVAGISGWWLWRRRKDNPKPQPPKTQAPG
ncbi:DUF4349 domain-containing protein [Hymenobacter psoromatis]|uniref:DUF4349 domain-containing protein n=1 Tax=Hymenobacter psoromatis TaxID=1484116 RepID=UPI001CBBACAC|nr:DUF4349 domain-containing protein [Hymenobacter psoromatis]